MISRRKIAKTRDDLPKKWRQEMSDALLTELAGPAVFARGAAYFQQRKVKLMRDGGGSARFHVHGSETYVTDLYFADDELGNQCTCPHAADGNFCKHAVAATLYWRALLSGDDPAVLVDAADVDPKALKAAITAMLSTGGHELDWRGVTGYAEQAERVVPLLQRILSEHPEAAREACDMRC